MISWLIFVFLAAGYGLMFYTSRQEKLRQQHQKQARLKEIWREESRQQIRDATTQRLENDPQVSALQELERQKQRLNQFKERVVQRDAMAQKQHDRDIKLEAELDHLWVMAQDVMQHKQDAEKQAEKSRLQAAIHALEAKRDQQRQQEQIEADRAQLKVLEAKRQQEMQADQTRIQREHQIQEQRRQQEMQADRNRIREESQRQKPNERTNARPIDKSDQSVPDRVSTERPKRSSTVTRQIKAKLEKLCSSDYQLAQRLVEGIRVDHPDRSEQWCWEKAVWDMERDRRR